MDGFRYAYDQAGRMTQEAHLHNGDSFGEQYAFDDADRPLRARYGVQDLGDPGSDFERETSYTQLPEGRWHARRDVDGQGNVLSDSVGSVDALNRYDSFGDVSFEYDGAATGFARARPPAGAYTPTTMRTGSSGSSATMPPVSSYGRSATSTTRSADSAGRSSPMRPASDRD